MRARGILADRPDAPAHVHPPPGTRNGRPLAVRPEDVPARDDPSGAAGTASSGPALHAGQLTRALRRRENWIQLLEFGVVGASGYIVNLAVYALLLKGAGLHYLAAATGSFLVAASWNYWWNRSWTFRAQRGHFGIQGMRFLIVSATVYCANIGMLAVLVSAGLGKILAQAIAIILVTPLNFLGNKLWSFRH